MGEKKPGPEARASAEAPGEKQPYEKPAVAWEEPLDVRPGLIAACAKVALQGGACDVTPSS